jgi:hypothetical protein
MAFDELQYETMKTIGFTLKKLVFVTVTMHAYEVFPDDVKSGAFEH